MRLRALLFVPGDRPERFAKAAASGADALILDLEDSVSAANKATARDAIASWLSTPRTITTFVRINPLDTDMAQADLD
ncbi:MAG: aldolase/citrate lyase family protein, partial [Sphingobium sp.]